MRGGVEMMEEDSTAVKGAGSALLGMGTSADWPKEDVGVHSNVLGDAGDVAGYFDSRNHVVTCSKRVFGVASGVVAMREVSSSCHDVGIPPCPMVTQGDAEGGVVWWRVV